MRPFSVDTRGQLILYHWHPTGRSHVATPHLHLGPPLLAALGVKRSIHLPTGDVRLEDFVGTLIREFGVRPVRRDWARVLARAGDPSRAAPTRANRKRRLPLLHAFNTGPGKVWYNCAAEFVLPRKDETGEPLCGVNFRTSPEVRDRRLPRRTRQLTP